MTVSSPAHRPHIATIGDVMLDVIVDSATPLRLDDDTNASIRLSPGGQAANVAAWAAALGADATVIGPRGQSAAAGVVADRLTAAGVTFVGIDAGDVGTVVSITSGGTRTMASDAGPQAWLASLDPGLLPDGATVLHVSGYPLLRAADPAPLISVCAAARTRGLQLALDLASAAMIADYGPQAFVATMNHLAPTVIFANSDEWQAIGPFWTPTDAVVVVKDGSRDVTVIDVEGREARHRVAAAEAVDPTGAGDALAAGYLVGGIELGIDAAARCVATHGAQPV
ncbi:MAG TPA: carbohydrate kinase family protein [Nocardioidaceae bacterium]|nr:carbohydrate kinase family protein [Nocardioidaceae bacterium]